MIVGRVRESQTAIKVTNRVNDCIPRLACNEFKIELIDLKPSDLPQVHIGLRQALMINRNNNNRQIKLP
jgi:hypothetical protein